LSLKSGIRHQASGIRKFLLIPAICLLSAGCGFHPIYARSQGGDDVATKLATVKVQDIPEREGQIIKNNLEFLLNPGNAPAAQEYSLKITVKDQHRELGINTDLRVTRYDVVPTAHYELISLADNKVVDSGHVTIKSSYNRTTSEFATYVAEENSTKLADQEIAEELRSRLVYYFSK